VAPHRSAGRGSHKHRLISKQSLAGKAGRALGLSFTNTALAKLGTTGVGIALARMLGPHAFGTYAVAFVALRVVISLNDLGVSLAIVRWPGDPREITPTVTTISLVTSLVLYAGCYFGAPGYSAAMGAPAAVGVVRVLAIVVVIDAIVATPVGLLQRHFRQDQRMIADQVNVWLGTGVTLLLAIFRFGAMSLAIGRLAGCAAALVLLVIFSPEPLRLGFNRAKARPLLRFGLPLAGSGVIVFAVGNVDQLIVGRTLGVTALGFFVLACNLSSWPVTMFSQPVRMVAPPTFARLRDSDPAAMPGGFLTAAGVLATVSLPVCLLLSGAAWPAIGFVYGPEWLPAAKPLVWLSVLAALQILFELSYDYFVVLGKSRVVFTMQLVWLVVLIPALVAGALLDGTWGLALAEAAVAAVLTLPWYLRELQQVGVRARALAGRLWLPLAGAALAGLVAAAAARLAPSDFTALLAGGVATLGIIGALGYHVRADLARLRQRKAAQPRGTVAPAPIDRHDLADSTGPIPLARDPALVPERSLEALPLYQATVESMRWDPAAAAHAPRRRHRRNDVSHDLDLPVIFTEKTP
jgi:O-antigen/teichoic acid export membrane protein